MTEFHGGQLIAKQLRAEGVDTVFGVLAGPMQYAYQAFPDEGILVVGCRHEEQAAFMAQAWGYINHKPGVVITGSGPGTTNTITSLHVAQENGWPLVVMGGSVASRERGIGGFQECDQVPLAAPTCKWAAQVDSVERVPEFVHMGLGRAVTGRPGAVYLDFPAQLLWQTAPEDVLRTTDTSPRVYVPGPDADGVRDIADMLASAECPLILIGKGAAWEDAGTALTRLADLGIPFVADPMGRGVVTDDHDMHMGSVRSQALAGADAVVLFGGRFDWMFPPYHRSRIGSQVPKIAQVDVEAEALYGGVNLDVGLISDTGRAADAIADELAGRALKVVDSTWVDDLREGRGQKEVKLSEKLQASGSPINHYQLWREVRDAVDRDAIIVMDGEATPGVGRIVMPNFHPRHRLDSGTTSCMGIGVPYAIGAKLARPDQQVVAVLGDYAFGASAMEVETAARLGANVVFVVDNNAGIVGHVFQDAWFGPEGQPIAELLPARYDKLAEMVGGHYEHVEETAELRGAIKRALGADTVSVVNVATDPMDHGLKRGANWFTTGYYFTEVESVGY